MQYSPLTAISPLDGRYNEKLQELQPICSEFGLIKYRVIIEVRWLEALAANPQISEIPYFNDKTKEELNKFLDSFSLQDAKRVKEIEKTTNHDVKAVEYFLKEKFKTNKELKKASEFIHFGCTSEDINNLAYGLMLQTIRGQVLAPNIETLIQNLTKLAHKHAEQPMLARTHGQSATPTTVGKELANFVARLRRQYQQILTTPIMGKFNGAVGNYNAHIAAYPEINWLIISKEFVEIFGLVWNQYTTQIESHDALAEMSAAIMRFNIILINFCRDIWSYISLGYFQQKTKSKEVGSSTMPHKVNPIDFENAEGNLGMANALLDHFINKLPISRLQRDLSDSTVLRNLGSAFAYATLAYKSIIAGLEKLELNNELLSEELNNNWQVLAEPIQTVMRRHGIKKPYEQLKQLTRNKKITKKLLHEFINASKLPENIKKNLKKLTPNNYTGLAAKLAKNL